MTAGDMALGFRGRLAARTRPEAFRVLLVCTGNLCRSPQAAALLRERIPAALDGWGAAGLQVTSAGTSAPRALPMDPIAASELERIGVAVDAVHRSRQISRSLLARSDLVLTMTTRHEAQVASLGRRRVADRLFTLAGFTMLAEALAESQGVPAPARHDDFALFMRHVVAAAAAEDRPRTATVVEIDIPDPRGFGVAAHRQTTERIDVEARRLAGALRRIAQLDARPDAGDVGR